MFPLVNNVGQYVVKFDFILTLWMLSLESDVLICGRGGGAGRGNSRYINGEVPTKKSFPDSDLEKYLEKGIPVLEKSRSKVFIRSLLFTNRKVFRINSTCLKNRPLRCMFWNFY